MIDSKATKLTLKGVNIIVSKHIRLHSLCPKPSQVILIWSGNFIYVYIYISYIQTLIQKVTHLTLNYLETYIYMDLLMFILWGISDPCTLVARRNNVSVLNRNNVLRCTRSLYGRSYVLFVC